LPSSKLMGRIWPACFASLHIDSRELKLDAALPKALKASRNALGSAEAVGVYIIGAHFDYLIMQITLPRQVGSA
jgi:hypothetical protein